MSTKSLVISSLVIVGLIAAGSGMLAWRTHKNKEFAKDTAKALAASTTTENVQTQSGSAGAGLNFSESDNQNVVSESVKNSLGNQSGQSQQIDPSTFSQYDKYKGGDKALFAEVQTGTGDQLTVNKKAAVIYKGWLTNGQLFDSSKADDKGKLQPFIFTLGAHQVIPGWEQGMVGMKAGGTRMLIIPPAVGYGPAGQGPIPPDAVLVFQVQLLAIE